MNGPIPFQLSERACACFITFFADCDSEFSLRRYDWTFGFLDRRRNRVSTFIFDRLKWLLGGFLMPITLFPDWLLKIVEWLPFSLMIFRPASLAVKFDWSTWADLSIRQLGLILVMGLLAQGLYRMGVRRLDVNGG
jgi:ABC-type uncharacterized transport system permease subunit